MAVKRFITLAPGGGDVVDVDLVGEALAVVGIGLEVHEGLLQTLYPVG
jgi:hypothetical protein